jgi:hypothetical protein
MPEKMREGLEAFLGNIGIRRSIPFGIEQRKKVKTRPAARDREKT